MYAVAVPAFVALTQSESKLFVMAVQECIADIAKCTTAGCEHAVTVLNIVVLGTNERGFRLVRQQCVLNRSQGTLPILVGHRIWWAEWAASCSKSQLCLDKLTSRQMTTSPPCPILPPSHTCTRPCARTFNSTTFFSDRGSSSWAASWHNFSRCRIWSVPQTRRHFVCRNNPCTAIFAQKP